MVKNGNLRFILLELILVDVPPIESSNGQEWQFEIYTVRTHIGRSTGRYTPHYRHLVVKNANLRFILFNIIFTDQLADIPSITGI